MYRKLGEMCTRSNVLVSNEKYFSVDEPLYTKVYVYPNSTPPKPDKKPTNEKDEKEDK